VKNSFREDLPSVSIFDEVNENERFYPLPEDWLPGMNDVMNSTGAIAEGRYKMVNLGGANGYTKAAEMLQAGR